MRSRTNIAFLLVFYACIAAPYATLRAQDNPGGHRPGLGSPIGKVMSVAGVATVERSSAVVIQVSSSNPSAQASVGDYVYKDDVIQTGPNSKISIVFTDGTAFNIASEARMALNEFVYDPNGSSNSALVSLISGTFTFVAGKVAKTGSMKIDTPVATMGIRGTTPHVEIMSDGTVKYATLIEEKKGLVSVTPHDAPQNQPNRPVKRRQGKATTAPQESSAELEAAYKKMFDFKVRICREC